jgi:hypothetical protein
MITSNNKILIKSIGFGDKKLFIELNTGRVLVVPTSYTKKLSKASEKELKEYRLVGGGRGIHFPLIDEDISVDGIIRDFGNEVKRVNITLPLLLLDKIDNFAKKHNLSRSALMQKATNEYINSFNE